MKTLYTIIALLFLRPVDAQQFEGDNRIFLNKAETIRNARVSALEVIYYRLFNGKPIDSSMVQLNTYDSLGNLLQMLGSNFQCDYSYSTGSDLQKVLYTDRRSGHKYQYELFYDRAGRLFGQKTTSTKDTSIIQYRIEADENNRPLRYYIRDRNGHYNLYKVYEYIGENISSIRHFRDKKVHFAELFEHDSISGKVVKYHVSGRKKTKVSESAYKDGQLVLYHEEPPEFTGRWVVLIFSPVYHHYYYHPNGLVAEKELKQFKHTIARQRYLYTYRN